MKYALALLICLLAAPCFAVFTRTYTVCESGCDYPTLQAAENALEQDLVANDSALTIEIQNTWVSADGVTEIAGSWVSDATRFLTVTAVGAARAGAKWSTTAYRLVSSGETLDIRQIDFLVLDGIQVQTTGTSHRVISTGTFPNDLTIKNCFIRGNGGSGNGIHYSNTSSSGLIVRNNVIIDCGGIGINVSTSAPVKIDNNTIENCGTGITTAANDVIARNNIIWNCTTPLSGDFNTTTLSEENYTDASSLSYGSCGSCGTGDQLSQSDPFVDLAGEDYSLKSGATAIDAGKDLSGDFTDAIGNKTRSLPFDKGADEFITVAATGKKVMIRK